MIDLSMKTIIIATSHCCKRSNWDEFEVELRKFFPSLGKIGMTDGPGCANLVVQVPANEMEEVGQQLCLALFPARWTETSDAPIEGFQIQLESLQD